MPICDSLNSQVTSSARALHNPTACIDVENYPLAGKCDFPVVSGSGSSRKRVACQYKNKEPLYYVDACSSSAWTIAVWEKESPQRHILVPFRCRSWRHEGDCRRWKNSQDFSRILQGIKSKDDNWSYLVLTLRRLSDYERHKPSSSESLFKAYRSLYVFWSRLRKRITRMFGVIRYVAMVEQHRDGYPHINVCVHNGKLHGLAESSFTQTRRRLNVKAVQCGFGFRFWIEPVRSKEAISGYFVKLLSETCKLSQVPVSAPRGFRRLRSSQKFLPPVYKNLRLSGALVQECKEVVESNPNFWIGQSEFYRYQRKFTKDWNERKRFYSNLKSSMNFLTFFESIFGRSYSGKVEKVESERVEREQRGIEGRNGCQGEFSAFASLYSDF